MTCNLYTHEYAASTQQYIMITILDDLDNLQVSRGLDHQENAMPKPMPARQQGFPQPGFGLVTVVPPANQKSGWRIPANQRKFTAFGYFSTFDTFLYKLNV